MKQTTTIATNKHNYSDTLLVVVEKVSWYSGVCTITFSTEMPHHPHITIYIADTNVKEIRDAIPKDVDVFDDADHAYFREWRRRQNTYRVNILDKFGIDPFESTNFTSIKGKYVWMDVCVNLTKMYKDKLVVKTIKKVYDTNPNEEGE